MELGIHVINFNAAPRSIGPTLADVDGFVSTAPGCAALGFELVNVVVLPQISDPTSFVNRLGDEVVPKLAEIG